MLSKDTTYAGVALAALVGTSASIVLYTRLFAKRRTKEAVLNHIADHRSVRKFSGADVDDALLDEIISTAMRSSTNGNMQTYSVIVTRDLAEREQLARIHDNAAIATAPVVLTFVSDWTRMNAWCRLGGAFEASGQCYNNFNAFLTGNKPPPATNSTLQSPSL